MHKSASSVKQQQRPRLPGKWLIPYIISSICTNRFEKWLTMVEYSCRGKITTNEWKSMEI